MNKKIGTLVICGIWGLAAHAETESADAHIVNTVHATNMLEIQVGQLAKTQGQMQGVKDYGQHLVTDHQKAEKQLAAFAAKHNLTVTDPTPMNDKERADAQAHAALKTKLASLRGADFDREFTQAMEKGHADAVAMLTSASKDKTVGADLKSLIAQLLPTLKHHEKMASTLNVKTNGSAR